MENMGENFANSSRREDKMRNRGEEGGIALKRKRRRRGKKFQCKSGYISKGSRAGHTKRESLLDIFLSLVGMEGRMQEDELRWVQRSSGSNSSPQSQDASFDRKELSGRLRKTIHNCEGMMWEELEMRHYAGRLQQEGC